MIDQVILSFGIAVGVISVLIGILINFLSYTKTTSLIENQITQAEYELQTDLNQIDSKELIQTQSGQELDLILKNEFARSKNKSPKPITIMYKNGSIEIIIRGRTPLSTGVFAPKDLINKSSSTKDD